VGYDESSEANLINRKVKIDVQQPRMGDQMGGEQRGDGGASHKKGTGGGKSGGYEMKRSHVRQTDCRRCS